MPTDPTKVIHMDDLYKKMFKKGYMTKEIECCACGKIHDPKSEEFITVVGNIMMGLGGGLIGNNFDKKGKLFRLVYFCIPCFKNFANKQNRTIKQINRRK